MSLADPVMYLITIGRMRASLIAPAAHIEHAQWALGSRRQFQLTAWPVKGLLISPGPVQVVAAFKILTSDPQVKAILVNIFGAPGGPRTHIIVAGWQQGLPHESQLLNGRYA